MNDLSESDIRDHRARVDALLREKSEPLVSIQGESHDLKKRMGQLHSARTWREKEAKALELAHCERVSAELLKEWRNGSDTITADRYRAIVDKSSARWTSDGHTLSQRWQIEDIKAQTRAVEERTDRLRIAYAGAKSQ